MDWRLLIEEQITKIGLPLYIFMFFAVSRIFCVLKCFQVFGSLPTSPLCVRGELAGGGYLAIAVGVTDR